MASSDNNDPFGIRVVGDGSATGGVALWHVGREPYSLPFHDREQAEHALRNDPALQKFIGPAYSQLIAAVHLFSPTPIHLGTSDESPPLPGSEVIGMRVKNPIAQDNRGRTQTGGPKSNRKEKAAHPDASSRAAAPVPQHETAENNPVAPAKPPSAPSHQDRSNAPEPQKEEQKKRVNPWDPNLGLSMDRLKHVRSGAQLANLIDEQLDQGHEAIRELREGLEQWANDPTAGVISHMLRDDLATLPRMWLTSEDLAMHVTSAMTDFLRLGEGFGDGTWKGAAQDVLRLVDFAGVAGVGAKALKFGSKAASAALKAIKGIETADEAGTSLATGKSTGRLSKDLMNRFAPEVTNAEGELERKIKWDAVIKHLEEGEEIPDGLDRNKFIKWARRARREIKEGGSIEELPEGTFGEYDGRFGRPLSIAIAEGQSDEAFYRSLMHELSHLNDELRSYKLGGTNWWRLSKQTRGVASYTISPWVTYGYEMRAYWAESRAIMLLDVPFQAFGSLQGAQKVYATRQLMAAGASAATAGAGAGYLGYRYYQSSQDQRVQQAEPERAAP